MGDLAGLGREKFIQLCILRELVPERKDHILENSDFIYLLNLSAGDRKLMTERLNISAEQLAYVTNADPGSGLLFFQNVILPFKDEFPKTTELYRLLTTKPSEVSHDGETG